MTRQTVTQQIEDAIADAGGSTRDALNDALAGRDAAVALLRVENERAIALLEVLETIRAAAWIDGPLHATSRLKIIDNIACDALKAAGEIATTGTIKED